MDGAAGCRARGARPHTPEKSAATDASSAVAATACTTARIPATLRLIARSAGAAREGLELKNANVVRAQGVDTGHVGHTRYA